MIPDILGIWDSLPKRMVKWGFIGYLLGHILKLILFIPVGILLFFILGPIYALWENYKHDRDQYLSNKEEIEK
jgi:hypothetical protein